MEKPHSPTAFLPWNNLSLRMWRAASRQTKSHHLHTEVKEETSETDTWVVTQGKRAVALEEEAKAAAWEEAEKTEVCRAEREASVPGAEIPSTLCQETA